MTCLAHGSTLVLHTNTHVLLSGGSYPDERHKFLTGVLVRAANRQMVGKDSVSLTTGECQHFNTPGGCTWTLNESLREGGGGMVENHGPLRQKWNMAGSDGMHRITMKNEEWGDRSLQPKHCRGSFWSTGTELLWLLQQSGLGSHQLITGNLSSIQQELLCLYREPGKKRHHLELFEV